MTQADTITAKLIKAYIYFNPNCTAKDIAYWLEYAKFGLRKQYTPIQVTRLIRHFKYEYSNNNWFADVEIDKTKAPLRYRINKGEPMK